MCLDDVDSIILPSRILPSIIRGAGGQVPAADATSDVSGTPAANTARDTASTYSADLRVDSPTQL